MRINNKRKLTSRLKAIKSTGPKSTEGKRRCSRNSCTHGAYAKNRILPMLIRIQPQPWTPTTANQPDENQPVETNLTVAVPTFIPPVETNLTVAVPMFIPPVETNLTVAVPMIIPPVETNLTVAVPMFFHLLKRT